MTRLVERERERERKRERERERANTGTTGGVTVDGNDHLLHVTPVTYIHTCIHTYCIHTYIKTNAVHATHKALLQVNEYQPLCPSHAASLIY